jgi:hypothetical protein
MTWCEDCQEDHDEIEKTWLIAQPENRVEHIESCMQVVDRGEVSVQWEEETGFIDYSEYYAEDIAWRIAFETIHDLREQVRLLLEGAGGLQI